MKLLDKTLELSLHGDFRRSYVLLKELEENNQSDNRIAFNLGWYEIHKGNLLEGHKYLSRGRNENVFGNRHIGSCKPIWDGQRGVNVLMEMEGGLGDQIHAVRYAKDVASYGNRVVLSGCQNLVDLMIDCEGVSAFVQHEAALGTYHDYWLPSMDAPIPLGLEWKDVSGEPYIRRTGKSEGKVGVKWSGNPMFEHEQHRLFPSEIMFDAVRDLDCISLQKEDGETDGNTPTPDWMEKPSLETWADTRRQLSRCDLVITSCTAVAHLAGAMGIQTWIVVPILPYYLWALPGHKTPHYDSVTLFRQEQYGDWEAPFKEIKKKLQERELCRTIV
jgi:hypothetical protein